MTMPKYRVTIEEIKWFTGEVDANSSDEAEGLAENIKNEPSTIVETEYHRTIEAASDAKPQRVRSMRPLGS
jgi:hypothetical protein